MTALEVMDRLDEEVLARIDKITASRFPAGAGPHRPGAIPHNVSPQPKRQPVP